MHNNDSGFSALSSVTNDTKCTTFSVCTLGCRVNQYESRAIEEEMIREGFLLKSFDESCDVYIINTCAVTAESERKSRQMARRAAKRNPNAVILMTGCQAQLHPEACEKLPQVRYIGGNASKMEIIGAVKELIDEKDLVMKCTRAPENVFENYSVSEPDHTRAYIKIEDGCKNKCAYCVIPKVRGPVRSKPIRDVITEVSAIAEKGYKEIVLTGIEVCDYQYGLTELLNLLSEIDGIERIRLASVNPAFINKRFIDEIKDNKKFCHHFHLSLQSCCDRTLRAMRRPYNVEILKRNVGYIREIFPDVAFTADVICGFPGESEEDFSETVKVFSEIGLIYAHIFPYSPRPETEAAEMPYQVDEAVKAERCSRLHAVMLKRRGEIISDMAERGDLFSVLFEEKRDGFWYGHTENFIEVAVESNELLEGQLRKVRLLNKELNSEVWCAEIVRTDTL